MRTDAANQQRLARVRGVVDDCITRRIAGEALSSEQVIGEHQDLMPELGEALRGLSIVEQAERRARESSVGGGRAGPPAPASGVCFPGYTIVGEIHRGGQGVVYEAIQQRTQRRVAIKVIALDAGGLAAGRARFDREVEVLGRLNHPNILAIHDTGLIAGAAYFVADYIPGEPLGAGYDARAASRRDTLELFVKVCDAVNAAHLLGITHRDLKPGNILVDRAGQPHVLDFGLAKVSGPEFTAGAMTADGSFVGSLPWASPEQIGGAAEAVDVRTDVYSIGAMLYQVLTGEPPYANSGTVREVMNNILEVAPRRPSVVAGGIDDELDTIVLKALAKDREQRYQSAGELARDLRHYLAGEAIEAKRDSVSYVLAKHLRKYRLHLFVAVTFVAVIAAGLFASLVFWRAAVRERDAALAAGDEARRQAGSAAAANDFVREVLALASPEKAAGRHITVREAVEQAARNINAFTAGRPESEATLRASLGQTYHSLGHFEVAVEQLGLALELQRAHLGAEHAETLRTQRHLAGALADAGRTAEAVALLHHAAALQRATLGETHPDTLASVNTLAWILFGEGEVAQAEPLFRMVLDASGGREPPDPAAALVTMSNLAATLIAQGKVEEAEPLAIRGAEGLARQLGATHPSTLYARNIRAWCWYSAGRYSEAEPMFRSLVDDATQVLGIEHPYRLYWLGNHAWCLLRLGDLDGALHAFEAARAGQARVLPEGHLYLVESSEGLARTLMAQGRFADAEEPALRAHAAALARFGATHRTTWAAAELLMDLYAAWGDTQRADAWRATLSEGTKSGGAP
ncbi:MAG: serine/threonine protein kinase [Planctomycetes bacterium]|nr:serine/threonine protein kinase [Planctomycetota bacterium]